MPDAPVLSQQTLATLASATELSREHVRLILTGRRTPPAWPTRLPWPVPALHDLSSEELRVLVHYLRDARSFQRSEFYRNNIKQLDSCMASIVVEADAARVHLGRFVKQLVEWGAVPLDTYDVSDHPGEADPDTHV